MLKDNLRMLRSMHGYSQTQLADRIGVTRQAYAKWESGLSVPDIGKCMMLCELYGVSLDSLVKTQKLEDLGEIPPAPVGKNIWGTVTVNERGQIVLPKAAREALDIKAETRLVVLSDGVGIALVPVSTFEKGIMVLMENAARKAD